MCGIMHMGSDMCTIIPVVWCRWYAADVWRIAHVQRHGAV